VIVSPDHGGVVRARKFSHAFANVPLAIIDKRRETPNSCEVMQIIGNVKGKVCVMIDDMIDTGGTLIEGAKALLAAGAKAVYAAATHAVLSGNAIERIEESPLVEVVVTNTIPLNPEYPSTKIKQLSIGKLLGRALLNLLHDEAISPIFDNITNA
jgi:ribose-phosphate pyrophosphokinase